MLGKPPRPHGGEKQLGFWKYWELLRRKRPEMLNRWRKIVGAKLGNKKAHWGLLLCGSIKVQQCSPSTGFLCLRGSLIYEPFQKLNNLWLLRARQDKCFHSATERSLAQAGNYESVVFRHFYLQCKNSGHYVVRTKVTPMPLSKLTNVSAVHRGLEESCIWEWGSSQTSE